MRRLLFLLLVLSTVAQAQSPQAVKAYIERYKTIAMEEMKAYGIPASVTLAQGIHESGCGCSALALNSNNHFGIKCHNEWSGQTYHHDDDQPQECFRVYNCPEESFRDHSEFLKTRPRYASLFSLEPTDYRAWAKGLKAAGYATNPRYPEIIIKLIEDYNLSQYDWPYKTATTKTEAKDTKEVQLIKQAMQQQFTATIVPVTAAASKPVSPSTPNIYLEERQVNGIKAVVYKSQMPIQQLATNYNLTVQQIYSFNDMTADSKFKDNDLVYLEAKKSECPYSQYEVSQGETMRDISQKFAIKLSDLVKRNELPQGCEPAAGEMVVLRGKREVPLKFKVTGTASTLKSSLETSPITSPDTKVHTVGSKETLYSISREFNIPVDTLKKLNGLNDEDIKIGQTLIVDL